MTPAQAFQYLDSFINYEIRRSDMRSALFDLGRVRALLGLFGNPSRAYACLHVAGSKGKGSTCAFLAAMLARAGYSVGLYTSPHLWDVRERVRVLNGRTKEASAPFGEELFKDMISPTDLCAAVEELRPAVEELARGPDTGRLTYFEVLTALALGYFRRKKVDYAVLETGLGGRLDATNAVESCVAGLTPISLEHTRELGSTLAAIAREKAAIVKQEGQAVVVAPQEPEAGREIDSWCGNKKARVALVGKDIVISDLRVSGRWQEFTIKGRREEYAMRIPLLGSFQAVNAAVAVGMLEFLRERGARIGKEDIEDGAAGVFWPGRCEIISENPCLVLDGAHNSASARCLAEMITNTFPRRKIILIFGISDDKEVGSVLGPLLPAAGQVILTRARHPRARAWSEEDVARIEDAGRVCQREEHVAAALGEALRQAGEDDVILVTGSLFLVAEARKEWVLHKPSFGISGDVKRR